MKKESQTSFKEFLKNKFDKTYPQYGFLSNFQQTILLIGGIGGFIFGVLGSGVHEIFLFISLAWMIISLIIIARN